MERKVAEFSQHVTGKLKTLINKCSCFLIALDESIDVTDISQLMIFARLVDFKKYCYEAVFDITK